jgi:hypothetical protein
MNPPHPPDTEPTALADAFDNVRHSLGPDLTQNSLSESLATTAALTARLSDALHDIHRTLATGEPADRADRAATATQLCHAVSTASQAVSELAAAHDAHLFIDHFPNRYGNPEVNTAFARARISTALTTARDRLAETITHLRPLTSAGPAGQLQLAARARSPRIPSSAGPTPSTVPTAPAPPTAAPPNAKGR